MATTYTYTNITTAPHLMTCDNGNCIDGIHYDIEQSAMTDKVIEYCRWDEDIETLKVVFTTALSGADKTILDGIVDDNS